MTRKTSCEKCAALANRTRLIRRGAVVLDLILNSTNMDRVHDLIVNRVDELEALMLYGRGDIR